MLCHTPKPRYEPCNGLLPSIWRALRRTLYTTSRQQQAISPCKGYYHIYTRNTPPPVPPPSLPIAPFIPSDYCSIVSAAAKMPSWLQHTLGSLFIHQDLVFLHHQARELVSLLPVAAINSYTGRTDISCRLPTNK